MTPLEQGNRAWYRQGRTQAAVDAFRAAVQDAPGDPVALLQLARALWAAGEVDDAREAILQAAARREALSPLGERVIERERERLFGPEPPVPAFLGDPHELDLDRLDRRPMSHGAWSAAAIAAEARQMHGLADVAYRRSQRIMLDGEDAREEEARRGAAERERDQLPELRRSAAPSTRLGSRPPTAPAVAVAPARMRLDARVEPALSAVGEAVDLIVSLTNAGAQPIAVNRRLLAVPDGTPRSFGELWTAVEGPPGYSNNVRTQVRSGPPGDRDFGVLAPGASVERTVRLTHFHGMDRPGRYRVSVAYRNSVPGRIQQLPVFTGELEAADVELERL